MRGTAAAQHSLPIEPAVISDSHVVQLILCSLWLNRHVFCFHSSIDRSIDDLFAPHLTSLIFFLLVMASGMQVKSKSRLRRFGQENIANNMQKSQAGKHFCAISLSFD
jgi:hypothetical protein